MSRAKRLGGAFLLLQLAWFAREQLSSSRYFCWAPLHEHVFYRIDAERAGVHLSEVEIVRRYGRWGASYDAAQRQFWELNAAAHVLDSVRWREDTLPAAERMHVTVRYRIDDREPVTWTYAP
jgi:hypothetical protein